jgi:dihydroorotate dehydrogenase (fumarate)
MDLSTSFLSFKLENPLIPGASPLTCDLAMVKRLEDAGAPMIVMPSIFQEQLDREQVALNKGLEQADNSYAESLTYLPRPDDFRLGPEEYLEQLSRIKAAVKVPVVASLNGRTRGAWVSFARLLHTAGADALELNLYDPLPSMEMDAATAEKHAIEIVRDVCQSVSIPVAVKLSPFYSSFLNFAHQLDVAGARGLVLFNRFYQPDIDVEKLEAISTLQLSTSDELLPRLRSTAALYGHCSTDLAITGGVHTALDVLKSVMVGASAVQMVSALLQHGPKHLESLRAHLSRWLELHDYDSLRQARGSMSLVNTPNPGAFERGNYAKILQTWSAD